MLMRLLPNGVIIGEVEIDLSVGIEETKRFKLEEMSEHETKFTDCRV